MGRLQDSLVILTADHVGVFISMPMCVRTGALYKSEQMHWSPFKPHLEQECDDLLKIPVAL